MYFQIENGEVTGYSPAKENLKGATVKSDLPKGFDPETHYLKNLKWDGKKVTLDSTWKPPKVASVDDKLRVLAKKVNGHALSTDEAKILTDMKIKR